MYKQLKLNEQTNRTVTMYFNRFAISDVVDQMLTQLIAAYGTMKSSAGLQGGLKQGDLIIY